MKRGVAYGILAGALWGTVFLAPQWLPDFPALQVSAGRYIAYGLVSLLFALPRGRALWAKVSRADIAMLLWLAMSGNLVYYTLLTTGVHWAGVAATSLIIGVLPVTIAVAGAHDTDAAPLKRLGLPLALVLAGIACINVDVFRTPLTPAWERTAGGIACALGALACWTWFAVANGRYLQRHPRFSGNEWSILWGIASGVLGLALWIVLAVLPEPARSALGLATFPAERWKVFWIVIFALAIGASWLGNGLWNAASRRLPMTLTGQMIVFETLFALLYGFIYEGRMPRLLEWAAIGLLSAGVIGAVRVHSPSRAAPPAASARP